MSGKTRNREEIQKAHDMLHGFIELAQGELDPAYESAVMVACDVLCWVLVHEHNQTFATNLQQIHEAMEESGLMLKKIPEI